METESVTIVEGGESEEIEIKLKFPPIIFCAANTSDENCTITIATSVMETEELTCNNKTVPQFLIGWEDNDMQMMCGFVISMKDWEKDDEYKMNVIATKDNLKDGTQERKLVFKSGVHDKDMVDAQYVEVRLSGHCKTSILSFISEFYELVMILSNVVMKFILYNSRSTVSSCIVILWLNYGKTPSICTIFLLPLKIPVSLCFKFATSSSVERAL